MKKNKDAILISSNVLPAPQPTENGIPLVSKTEVAYTGSNNVASFEYGKNYNGLWLEKCTTESQYINAKTTAYMCDPDNWKEYVEGKAKYSAGGPTVEIIVASYKNEQVIDLKEDDDVQIKTIQNVNKTGYPRVITEGLTVNLKNELYNTGNAYWISSPSNSDTYMRAVLSNSIDSNPCGSVRIGLRPVVCLPASAIEVVGEGDNAVLNYK